jgi:hypothetical protein
MLRADLTMVFATKRAAAAAAAAAVKANPQAVCDIVTHTPARSSLGFASMQAKRANKATDRDVTSRTDKRG